MIVGLILFLVSLTALICYDYGYKRGSESESQYTDYWRNEAHVWRDQALNKKQKRQLSGFADREIEQLNKLWEREDGEE